MENVEPILPKFTVTLTAGQHGSVSGGGTYTQGTVITITATPDTDYKFSSWSDGNTDNPRQITVDRNINLSCGFEERIEPAPNEIWYTSTDSNIVTPNSIGRFGANIVSNTYVNGKGIIKFDGPVTQVKNGAFMLLERIQTMMLPEGLTEIDSTSFSYSNDYYTLTFPSTLSTIELVSGNWFSYYGTYIFKGTLSQWQNVTIVAGGTLGNSVSIQCADGIGTFYINYQVCFAKGTQITMADNTTKNIEDLKKGDVVIGWDEENKTTVDTVVQTLLIRQTTKTYILSGNDFEVEVTGEHKLYVNDDWVAVENIKIGDKLLHSDRTYTEVTSIKENIKEQTVYNLDCEENDTYFANGILAHNY